MRLRLRKSARSVDMRKALALASAGLVATAVGVRPTQDAVAQGGTRTITIYHSHTKEQETVTYKQFGSYDSSGLQKLNWLLRDWRADEPTKMDPQLFDIIWEVQRAAGSRAAVHVVSAYRSPGTNAMLARRSRGVAKNSQHMSGRALDFALPDVSVATVRDIGLRLQAGGVGYYPNANNPWVHLDTGGVRHWPKVSREHLVRLFPDEKTVHIPRDGKPLAGFEAARSIIEARGGSVSSGYIDIAEGRATGKTLFQILFGGGEDEDADVAGGRGRKGRTAVASRSSRNQQMAAASSEAMNEGSAVAFFSSNNSSTSVAPAPAFAPPARRPAATPAPAPVETKAPEPPKAPEPKPIEVAALQPTAATAIPLSTKTDADDERGRRVSIPLPQRRPLNIQTGPVLVNVPLPQSRPTTLLAAAQPMDPIGQILQNEPQKPVQVASAAGLPLPPSRPADLPGPIAAGLRTAPASAALAYAPQPAAQRQAPTAADRRGMDALIAQIATTASPARGARVAPVSVAAVAEIKTVTGRFEAAPKAEAAGFSGSVIRPIGPQGFRRTN